MHKWRLPWKSREKEDKACSRKATFPGIRVFHYLRQIQIKMLSQQLLYKQLEWVKKTKTAHDERSRCMPDCEGMIGEARLLRPATTAHLDETGSTQSKDFDGMRLVDNEKIVEAWNKAQSIHRVAAPDCDLSHMKIANEKKWGVCWKMTFKCATCNFTSPEFELYKEVPTNRQGPNPAAPNLGLGIGLHDTSLGNRGARRLIANMDVPPPVRSSMKTSNNVAKAVTELNQRDMSNKV